MKKQIFKNLLNLLLETGFIFNIIEKLYTFSLNNINEEKLKKFACLWIYEILLALIKVKNNQSNLIVKVIRIKLYFNIHVCLLILCLLGQ